MVFENVFPISKFNSTSEETVTEKSKVKAIGFIFHVISKSIFVFHAVPWERVALTDQFSRSQNDYFEN